MLLGMEIAEKEGRKARLMDQSHHPGCLLETHHPVQLAGMGDRTAGGSQGGDGDSVHLHKDVVVGREKLNTQNT